MEQARRWIATDFGGPEVLEEIEVDLSGPVPGEVAIAVRAAGMNPADYKHFGTGQDPGLLPLTVGSEVAGVIAALAPGTEIASGGGAVGDEVVVFRSPMATLPRSTLRRPTCSQSPRHSPSRRRRTSCWSGRRPLRHCRSSVCRRARRYSCTAPAVRSGRAS